MRTYLMGTDLLVGAEAVSTDDMVALGNKLAKLKPVSFKAADQLVAMANQALDNGRNAVKGYGWFSGDAASSATKTIDKAQGHIDWHRDNIAKWRPKATDKDVYAQGDDLKYWVNQSFVAYSSADTGRNTTAQNSFWKYVGENLDKLIADAVQVAVDLATGAGKVVGGFFSGLFDGLFSTGGLVLLGLAVGGVVAWKAGVFNKLADKFKTPSASSVSSTPPPALKG